MKQMKIQNTNPETVRQEDLYSYSILDTAKELPFEELAMLASSICQVPIALVGFMDVDRTWFKANIGFSLNETPRKLSLFAYTIDQEGLFEVQDTLNDIRFASQEIVKNQGIRYYGGFRLVSPKGHNLGVISVLDKVPRKLTFTQTGALEALAHQVVTLLELRKSYKHILELQELLKKKASNDVGYHLASSLSHEINNSLTILKGRAHIMRSKFSTLDNGIHEDLEIIESMIDRIATSLKVQDIKKKAS